MQKSNIKKKQKITDSRQSIDLKSQFKKVDTGIKNGVFIYTNTLSIEQFANKINKTSSEILKYFFLKGKIKNINTILTEEEMGELCLEYNYDFEKKVAIDESNILSNLEIKDDPSMLKPRPPIVTIMGHVDHGKTTLLDYIRKSNITKSEAGGITQSIGAYQIKYNNKKITFIDTPGHAIFTEMRARGANVTDIVILVVAADDGIKPQTIEAIDHAKAAKVPIIVFINKCDKPNVKPENVLKQLCEHDLTPEEWNGDTIVVKGSALNGTNIDKLLQAILLTSEILELKANPNRLGLGVVIESSLSKSLGPVATIIIKNGTVARGDMMIAGSCYGKIRAIFDENNHQVNEAKPSQPVKIAGLNNVPLAGDNFVVSKNEKDIKSIAEKIHLYQANLLNREQELLVKHINENDKKLIIILKTDTNGSLEAIKSMLSKINIDGVTTTIIRGATGGITKSDVELAKASKGLIIGFNVKPTKDVKDLANNQHVTIYFFDIIYNLNDTIKKMIKGKLDPILVETENGEAEVKQIWTHSVIGTIIGCVVNNGVINRNDLVRVLRDGVVIHKTKIASLRHKKDDITKIEAGKECGITLDKYNDLNVGDIIQSYKIVEKKQDE